ncbi:transporter substrate-binding domain-containing protein [Maridesulfovibrio sp.]|uniref:substrate-binding periplasmic protein n=1 Tax=Maridesulfovibrio sp. TaxID=2795000 RepID=UPI002A18D150|nr:transporter substrate-binding domain-containing protein [Maridesulfovibrio sp.]
MLIKYWSTRLCLFIIFYLLALSAISNIFPCFVFAGQKVDVWCYYCEPPFTINTDQGLKKDFVDLLNEEAKENFSFELLSMSRKRLDLFLAEGRPGIVLFVSPIWMKEQDKAKFVWSPPILHDRNEIVSRKNNPVNYLGPKSVYGLTMAGVFGHKYKDLDEAVAQGKITRKDAASMDLNLRTVVENRGRDFTTIPNSVLGYLLHKYNYEDRVYISPAPLTKYTRHILLNTPDPLLKKFIFNFTSSLEDNKKWKRIKDKYKLK